MLGFTILNYIYIYVYLVNTLWYFFTLRELAAMGNLDHWVRLRWCTHWNMVDFPLRNSCLFPTVPTMAVRTKSGAQLDPQLRWMRFCSCRLLGSLLCLVGDACRTSAWGRLEDRKWTFFNADPNQSLNLLMFFSTQKQYLAKKHHWYLTPIFGIL